MTASRSTSNVGRHVFGAATLASGLVTLAWHDYNDWTQLGYILNATSGPVFVYAVAALQIFGGAAILFGRSGKTGALVVGAVYLAFAVLYVPGIVAAPLIYNSWGNSFEQLSLVTGAALVSGRLSPAWQPETLNRAGRILFGICTASFALEQASYLGATAALVPKWLPPNQTFWALTTTGLFALAALALLTHRMALWATRLLTTMLVFFGLLVWLPAPFSDPSKHASWSETVETFAIAGAAWILADLARAS